MHSNRDGVSPALVNACGALAGTSMVSPRGHERLAAEGHLDFAVKDGEHLLEVVPVRRRTAARGHGMSMSVYFPRCPRP